MSNLKPETRNLKRLNEIRVTGSERALLIIRRHHGVREELGVLISLVLSVGMILLAIFGVWLWRIFAQIGEAAAMTSVDLP